jgi:hypothetical protein
MVEFSCCPYPSAVARAVATNYYVISSHRVYNIPPIKFVCLFPHFADSLHATNISRENI